MNEGWSADWVSKKLRESADITAVNLSSSGNIVVERKKGGPINVAVLEIRDRVEEAHVADLFGRSERPHFVLNVPSSAIWTGAAISTVHHQHAAFGGLGDLNRATRQENASAYRYKEYEFVETGLRQHRAVSEIRRDFDRKYTALRGTLTPFTIVMIDAYDMSAEHVRNAYDRYGKFDGALKLTSYGSITTAAHEASKELGAGAFKWGELLKRLAVP